MRRLRAAVRVGARTAADVCFDAAARLPPDSTTARALNRAGAAMDARSRSLDRGRRARPAARGAAADGGRDPEYERVAQIRWRFRVEVRQPLLLVTQIHRSGGTLLTRLLDGHPELHTVPHELGPLLPRVRIPLDPQAAWQALANPKLPGYFERGIRQAGSELHGDATRTPLLLPPGVHRRLFERALGAGASSERAVLDAYLTAYFNAWLDYANLHGRKRFVAGFEPGAHVDGGALRLDDVYPDGRIVSIVRDPWSWYVSARRWDRRFAAIGPAVDDWSRSTRAALELKASRPDGVLLMSFDALVRATEETMRELSSWLGIAFGPSLLLPTLNGLPVGSNSSFPGAGAEVSEEPSTARRQLLNEHEDRFIAVHASALFEEALRSVGLQGSAVS